MSAEADEPRSSKKGTSFGDGHGDRHKELIASHREVLAATDFFTAEVWTLRGLVTYYILCFIDIATRKVHVAGMTPHPRQEWMSQIARNVTMEDWRFLHRFRLLIHDRDSKFCARSSRSVCPS